MVGKTWYLDSVICFNCYILNLLTMVRNTLVKEIREVSHLQKCDSWYTAYNNKNEISVP